MVHPNMLSRRQIQRLVYKEWDTLPLDIMWIVMEFIPRNGLTLYVDDERKENGTNLRFVEHVKRHFEKYPDGTKLEYVYSEYDTTCSFTMIVSQSCVLVQHAHANCPATKKIHVRGDPGSRYSNKVVIGGCNYAQGMLGGDVGNRWCVLIDDHERHNDDAIYCIARDTPVVRLPNFTLTVETN